MKSIIKAMNSTESERSDFVASVQVIIQRHRSVVAEEMGKRGWPEEDTILVNQGTASITWGNDKTFSGESPLLDICDKMLTKKSVEPIDVANLVTLVNRDEALCFHIALERPALLEWGIGEDIF